MNRKAWSTKQSKIKAFIDKITPPNWNIYIKKEEFKYKPGTLNIKLEVFKNLNDCSAEWEDEEDWFGRVKGPMCFYLNSEFIKNEPRVIESIKKFGEGKIGRSHLQIYPDRETGELLDTLVHELAHIAADRWLAYKTKEYNKEWKKEWKCEIDSLSLGNENINHGPLFNKAFRLITIRKEKALGKESDEKIWEKLEGLI